MTAFSLLASLFTRGCLLNSFLLELNISLTVHHSGWSPCLLSICKTFLEMNIQVVVLAIFAERKLKFCYKSWIFNEFLNNALLWKRRPSPPLLLINMNVQDHDYYDCVLSPALSFLCGSNLILDHIDCLRHWSHMGWGMMHFFSVSPGDVPFPWSHGGKYHSIKKFAQIWVVPFFTQKVYFFFFFWSWWSVCKPSALPAP